MRRRGPFGAVAAVAAVLGIAAMPAVSYSAHVMRPRWLCSAHASKCATLIVHLNGDACNRGRCTRYPEKIKALRVSKLGSGPRCTDERPKCWGEVLGNWYTEDHKVRVAPGHYGIAPLEEDSPTAEVLGRSVSKEVTVRAGQTREVMLVVRLI